MASNSIEENFGYCILEALIFKTIPVLPKGLSHDELVNKEYLFTSLDEQIKIIEEAVINYSSKTGTRANKYDRWEALEQIVWWF